MKTKLLPVFLLIAAQAFAQDGLLALTGKPGNNIVLNDIRQLDFKTGVQKEVLLASNTPVKVFSSKSKKQITQNVGSFDHAQAAAIATLAYDTKNNKTIYMPMFSTNIYVLDNKSKEITLLENNILKTTPCDLGSQFTRMTTGADGAVYAVSNSGSQWIKIYAKNGSYIVEDLGELKDAASNGRNSIKVVNTGYGGDMIADADNNLYILAASGAVFKINAQDNTVQYLDKVKGLPQGFTLNGAAVDADGHIVLASARGGKLYQTNFESFEAQPVENILSEPVYDLASPYLLYQNKTVNNASALASTVDLYPTHVVDGHFNIKSGEKAVRFVEIFDASGQLAQKLELKNRETKTDQKIDVNTLKTGVYIVNLLDQERQVLSTKKILVNK